METGFNKGDSANLPKIDALMVATYFAINPDFCSSEYRNVKTSTSSRETYGDDAIGYVQLSRSAGLCTVKARVCPEHKIHAKPYSVTLTLNENEGKVMDVQCHDCAASLGGCKHAVAFLMWLHRRSEEPSSTSRECYWRKPKLAQVGSTLNFITAKQLSKTKRRITKVGNNQAVLADFLSQAGQQKLDNCQLMKHQPGYEPCDIKMFSLHYLFMKYNKQNDCSIFLESIKDLLTDDHIKNIQINTTDQNKSTLWYELRYGRITASIAYEASRCNTPDGTLISKIMGGRTPDMPSMRRGRILEEKVREAVEKILGKKIYKCGLFLSKENPMLAVSPDGVCNSDSLIEIKCPVTEQSSGNYLKSGKLSDKCYCQVQMQMHITRRTKCYFCVADSAFETNKNVQIVEVEYNEQYSSNILCVITNFWKNNVYPLLNQSTKVTSDL